MNDADVDEGLIPVDGHNRTTTVTMLAILGLVRSEGERRIINTVEVISTKIIDDQRDAESYKRKEPVHQT